MNAQTACQLSGISRFPTLSGFVTASKEKSDKDHERRPLMDNIRQAFERSGMTLTELGEGLGYAGPTARKRAWFLLYRTPDPRISTVLLIAKTLEVEIGNLVKV